jgi:hypothetical protein
VWYKYDVFCRNYTSIYPPTTSAYSVGGRIIAFVTGKSATAAEDAASIASKWQISRRVLDTSHLKLCKSMSIEGKENIGINRRRFHAVSLSMAMNLVNPLTMASSKQLDSLILVSAKIALIPS